MSSELIKKEDNKVTLKLTIEADTFDKAINSAYRKMRSRFNIPGFRKGRAPRKIIEMNYGPEIFYEEAINIVFPEAYEKAIEDNEINPVDMPSLDDIEIGRAHV